MAKTAEQWKVRPHGKLTEIGQNILTVTGEVQMPIGPFPRRMTVVRLSDGRLVIFSAIALGDDEMQRLESFGTPAFLIVPNDHHRMDAHAWKERYPAVQVIAPEGAREKVEKAVHVDSSHADFGDLNVVLVAVPGTQGHEAALEVQSSEGTTLVLNDVVGNIRGSSGFGGWLLRMMGFAGDHAQIPAPVKLAIVDDKAALRAQLLKWAALPFLKRIVVSHGDTIDENPSAVLRELAESLS